MDKLTRNEKCYCIVIIIITWWWWHRRICHRIWCRNKDWMFFFLYVLLSSCWIVTSTHLDGGNNRTVAKASGTRTLGLQITEHKLYCFCNPFVHGHYWWWLGQGGKLRLKHCWLMYLFGPFSSLHSVIWVHLVKLPCYNQQWLAGNHFVNFTFSHPLTHQLQMKSKKLCKKYILPM